MNQNIFTFIICFCLTLVLVSCGGGVLSNHPNGAGGINASTNLDYRRAQEDPASQPEVGLKGVLGPSCKSNDPKKFCIGLKYVAYENLEGKPTLSEKSAVSDLQGINRIWNQCNIGFQIEEYSTANPRQAGLDYNPANDDELTDIRRDFRDGSTLLVVITGTWNRSGTLGNTGANAWTSMPGETPDGVVLEKPVATFANIIAHELGHYLGLLHFASTIDVMSPIIYNQSVSLSEDQCSVARDTVNTYWQKMIR